MNIASHPFAEQHSAATRATRAPVLLSPIALVVAFISFFMTLCVLSVIDPAVVLDVSSSNAHSSIQAILSLFTGV